MFKHRSVSKAEAVKQLLKGKMIYCKHIDNKPYIKLNNPNSSIPIAITNGETGCWLGTNNYNHLIYFLSFDDGYSIASIDDNKIIRNKINDIDGKLYGINDLLKGDLISETQKNIARELADCLLDKRKQLEEEFKSINGIVGDDNVL